MPLTGFAAFEFYWLFCFHIPLFFFKNTIISVLVCASVNHLIWACNRYVWFEKETIFLLTFLRIKPVRKENNRKCMLLWRACTCTMLSWCLSVNYCTLLIHLRGVIWKFQYTCKVCTMIREKSFEYHCKGSLMYMGMGVILLKWWAIYFLNRLIGQVTVTHSLQYIYMMIRYVLR